MPNLAVFDALILGSSPLLVKVSQMHMQSGYCQPSIGTKVTLQAYLNPATAAIDIAGGYRLAVAPTYAKANVARR